MPLNYQTTVFDSSSAPKPSLTSGVYFSLRRKLREIVNGLGENSARVSVLPILHAPWIDSMSEIGITLSSTRRCTVYSAVTLHPFIHSEMKPVPGSGFEGPDNLPGKFSDDITGSRAKIVHRHAESTHTP